MKGPPAPTPVLTPQPHKRAPHPRPHPQPHKRPPTPVLSPTSPLPGSSSGRTGGPGALGELAALPLPGSVELGVGASS